MMNYREILTVALILISFQHIFSQQDGYWDKERTTATEIILGAGDRVLVKTEDFPAGTTEVVYRITLLDENQQLASSLVSLLKAIPDPTGISQGSAGAVFILSKISGNDKCKYAIFSNSDLTYKENGKTDKSCWSQNTPISKDAKLLSIDKSTCFQNNSNNMWFGFESENWIMNQKIILEVVPWVDNKLRKGWNLEGRKAILNQIKTSDLVKKMINKDELGLCILEKIQKEYKFQEFEKLLLIEKSKAFNDFGDACLSEKPTNNSILNAIRSDALQYFKNKKYDVAIDLLLTGIVDKGSATSLDYNALGTYYLFSKQYEKAIKSLKEGEKLDDSELLIKLSLAHACLFTNNFKAAKEIHKKYRFQNVTASQSWLNKTESDFEDFRKAGFQNEDFDRILKLLAD